MRVALYTRVSTTDQSCDVQLRELLQYGTHRSRTVPDECVDTGWIGGFSSPIGVRKAAERRTGHIDAGGSWMDGKERSSLRQDLQELVSLGARFIAIT